MKKSIYKTKEEMPMFLTVLDLANLLGISRASAYELVRQENFPKLKIVQGRTIILRDSLLELSVAHVKSNHPKSEGG